MPSRHCPRCYVALAELGITAGTAEGCPKCSGVWLDDAAFAEVRTQLYARLAGTPHEDADPRPDRSAPLACPQCKKPMLRTRVGHVEVDVCTGHGTWFDRDELARVAQAIARARAGDREPESGRVIGPELETELARSVSQRSLLDAVNQDLETDLMSMFHNVLFKKPQPVEHTPIDSEPARVVVVQQVVAPPHESHPHELRCPNCTAFLPPEAHGRWVCKYCNATLEL
jgi:Zn-finger nucleic acid-binding protein